MNSGMPPAGMRRGASLTVLIALEICVFSLMAPNFASFGNAAECLRTAIEIGLIAVAMTPLIISGGIDLSVGSMMGLGSVVLGLVWHDAGWPVASAVVAALGVGLLGGLLNGALIARFQASPLIVTLRPAKSKR